MADANSLAIPTDHTILLCVERRERVMALDTLLKQAGFTVGIATSVYDGLRQAEQDMPHLILSEPAFADGTASNLYDKLKQHPLLQKVPVALLIAKLSKEEAAALVKRKLAAIFPGGTDPRVIVEKIQTILRDTGGVSPHFVNAPRLAMRLSADVAFVGRSGTFLVSRSVGDVVNRQCLNCTFKNVTDGSLRMRAVVSLAHGADTFTLYPLRQVVGPGRAALSGLAEIKSAQQTRKTVMLLRSANDFYDGWVNVLAAYGWNVLEADNLFSALSLANKQRVHVVWLAPGSEHWSTKMARPSTELRSFIQSLTANQSGGSGPVILVSGGTLANLEPGTSGHGFSDQASSRERCHFLPAEAGIGSLVEALESCLIQPVDLLGRNQASHGHVDIQAAWTSEAVIVGWDERGLYFRSPTPFARGSKVLIEFDAQAAKAAGYGDPALWAGIALQAGPSRVQDGDWLVRLDFVTAGTSRLRLWEKVTRSVTVPNLSTG